MEETTIIRLAQLAAACVCVISGAAVARAAVNNRAERQWLSLIIDVVLSVAFLYVALELASRRIYV